MDERQPRCPGLSLDGRAVARPARLFATGNDAAALVLGGILVGVCGLVTVTNFCIPSTLLATVSRWRGAEATT
jgi:hypothetical protein